MFSMCNPYASTKNGIFGREIVVLSDEKFADG
ncbi:hypothetical protein U14_00387 [Candidatus Moduliflexus flocculans]|uniref:Uncharacterized protein n=1 Tax=Candidatus Moduliflexus flocculans TaxID=1499966 RepID=A0A0S6VV76_9BACT|nr:hypothetical protein U14_00387 [Candidatus Moduliflexus flocculans]